VTGNKAVSVQHCFLLVQGMSLWATVTEIQKKKLTDVCIIKQNLSNSLELANDNKSASGRTLFISLFSCFHDISRLWS
jgi:hypothetical protein